MRFHPFWALCALLAACVPQSGGEYSGLTDAGPVGDWVNESGEHFSLDADGVLGLPGQTARSGLTWSRQGEVLILRSLDTPGGRPREDRLGIVKLGSSRLELRSPDGESLIWKRSSAPVQRLNGTLFYRERMALPPEVTVSVQLMLPGKDGPVAASLAVESGQLPLPFRLHWLDEKRAKAPDKDMSEQGWIKATLLHGHDALFTTPEPVPVSLDAAPDILVQRVMPEGVAPEALAVPARFRGRTGQDIVTLYLEPDGLYLLRDLSVKTGDNIRLGRWIQIDRNHTLQLGRGSLEPLTASLRPAGSLLLTWPQVAGGEVELEPVVESLPEEPFRLHGLLRMVEGRPVLTECASGLDFNVQESGGDWLELEKVWSQVKQHQDLSVAVDVILRYRNGTPALTREALPSGGAGDIHMLEIAGAAEVLPDKLCGEPYGAAPLENTYWRLMNLDGREAEAFPNQSEPHLLLRSGGEATGSDGCNNFFMPWKSKDNSVHFEPGGATLMMCPHGMEQADAMMRALSQANTWAIHGRILELLRGDRVLAVFEAVEL